MGRGGLAALVVVLLVAPPAWADKPPCPLAEIACFEVCDVPDPDAEQPSPEFVAKLTSIGKTGHHINTRLGSALLERQKHFETMNMGEPSNPWFVDGRYLGPCAGLLAVFHSHAINDGHPTFGLDFYELRYGSEGEAARVATLLGMAWHWNYHPSAAVHSSRSVFVIEGRYSGVETHDRVARHFGAVPSKSRHPPPPPFCAPEVARPLDLGPDAVNPPTVVVIGFSTNGRLGWLERHGRLGPWTLEVADLVNDRREDNSLPGGVDRMPGKDLQALCARQADYLARITAEFGQPSLPVLEQPAADNDPTAIELRPVGHGHELWLRGRAGVRRVGTLGRSLAPPRVLGLLRSPFEPRIAIAVALTTRAGTTVRFLGARLDKGWSADAEPSR